MAGPNLFTLYGFDFFTKFPETFPYLIVPILLFENILYRLETDILDPCAYNSKIGNTDKVSMYTLPFTFTFLSLVGPAAVSIDWLVYGTVAIIQRQFAKIVLRSEGIDVWAMNRRNKWLEVKVR